MLLAIESAAAFLEVFLAVVTHYACFVLSYLWPLFGMFEAMPPCRTSWLHQIDREACLHEPLPLACVDLVLTGAMVVAAAVTSRTLLDQPR